MENEEDDGVTPGLATWFCNLDANQYNPIPVATAGPSGKATSITTVPIRRPRSQLSDRGEGLLPALIQMVSIINVEQVDLVWGNQRLQFLPTGVRFHPKPTVVSRIQAIYPAMSPSMIWPRCGLASTQASRQSQPL